MHIDAAKAAALIALVFMLLGLGAAIEAALSGIPGQAVWRLLLQPRSLVTILVLLATVIGLWLHFRLAWWLALVAGVFHLYRIAEFWTSFPAMAAENIPSQFLTAAFVVVLVLPATRRQCARPVGT